MIISAKGRYALRAMVELAKNGENFTSLKEIAVRESIPPVSYTHLRAHET